MLAPLLMPVRLKLFNVQDLLAVWPYAVLHTHVSQHVGVAFPMRGFVFLAVAGLLLFQELNIMGKQWVAGVASVASLSAHQIFDFRAGEVRRLQQDLTVIATAGELVFVVVCRLLVYVFHCIVGQVFVQVVIAVRLSKLIQILRGAFDLGRLKHADGWVGFQLLEEISLLHLGQGFDALQLAVLDLGRLDAGNLPQFRHELLARAFGASQFQCGLVHSGEERLVLDLHLGGGFASFDQGLEQVHSGRSVRIRSLALMAPPMALRTSCLDCMR